MKSETQYDAILIVSFGGPEGPDDVLPFLENVLRGKPVPRERMLEVAEHYHHFGGVSPINEQNRALISALRQDLDELGVDLPIYWGNRNWHPLLPDAVEELRQDGHRRVIAFFTSMFSCYSGCRQYRENLLDACSQVGEEAPLIQKVRKGFNHPLFIDAQADLVGQSLAQISSQNRENAKLLFTAHSIPLSMAEHSRYELQLKEASRLVAEKLGHENWELVFQSRSGPPQQPWLEPDVCDRIEELASEGCQSCVVIPIGFISDHMEVLFDLDTEAKEACEKLGVEFQRAATLGVHPKFVRMISELLKERIYATEGRPAIGELGPSHDVCPEDCCLYPRPTRPPGASRPAGASGPPGTSPPAGTMGPAGSTRPTA